MLKLYILIFLHKLRIPIFVARIIGRKNTLLGDYVRAEGVVGTRAKAADDTAKARQGSPRLASLSACSEIAAKNNAVQNIAIAKLDALGDGVIFVAAAKNLRKIFPSARISLFCPSMWSEIAVESQYFDNVIPFDISAFKKNLKYRLSIGISLRAFSFDKAVLVNFSRDFFYSDWFMNHLEAKEKIAWKADYSNTINSLKRFCKNKAKQKTICDKLFSYANQNYYSSFVDCKDLDTPKHEAIRHSELFSFLANTSISACLPSLSAKKIEEAFGCECGDGGVNRSGNAGCDTKNITNSDTNLAAKLNSTPYILVGLGSSSPIKCCKPNIFTKYINIAASRIGNKNCNIVFCGVAREEELYFPDFEAVAKKEIENFDQRCIKFFGRTDTLSKLISLGANASFIIGNDSALSHIAVAVKTPSFVFVCGGHFNRFHPYPKELFSQEELNFYPECICKPMPCFNCNLNCVHPLVDGKYKCIGDIE